MEVNYQNILDFITQFMYILAPVALIFSIVGIITNSFLDFVSGNRRVRL